MTDKDGISGGLSSQDNSDTGLSEGNFISIDEISNSGLNYQDVTTEGFMLHQFGNGWFLTSKNLKN